MLPMTRTRSPNASFRRRAGFGSDIDELFDTILRPSLNAWTAWTPAADLYESADEYVLELGLPGFEIDDIEVTVERGLLTVTGNRTAQEEDAGNRTYHLREHSYERFSRSFALPGSVTADEVEAEFDDGMLIVRLPKSAEAKPRRIAVRSSAS